ncbi:hypothetical protein EVA_06021 [gut metagenome]|uniref:Uncharacterized protein n=1 Tax=gut metagenome TaxID=749906 RepID=J9D005_9ZZZZ
MRLSRAAHGNHFRPPWIRYFPKAPSATLYEFLHRSPAPCCGASPAQPSVPKADAKHPATREDDAETDNGASVPLQAYGYFPFRPRLFHTNARVSHRRESQTFHRQNADAVHPPPAVPRSAAHGDPEWKDRNR